MGIAKEISELSSVTTKKGTPLAKRDATLVDQAGKTVRLTLWGPQAEDSHLVGVSNPVLCVTRVQVRDYQGVSLSSSRSSQIQVNPETPEGQKMRSWYVSEGHDMETVPIGQGMASTGRDRKSVV